jgi:subfamily B ATP-binding cassette protein MsbA
LVGPSGAGKSTIAHLVAGFYVPTKNSIWIDGIDLSTIRLNSYRKHVGVVLQDNFLFDGTIMENVSFSRPGASRHEIVQACKLARVDEFADRLPRKYDTLVGERGILLSGGQKQRIAIARAILANPRILVLDEATSSLDSETEDFVQQALRYLMQGRTTIVIAHRLSTIQTAHQILVLEHGRVVERGSHGDLCEARGRYFLNHSRQMLSI